MSGGRSRFLDNAQVMAIGLHDNIPAAKMDFVGAQGAFNDQEITLQAALGSNVQIRHDFLKRCSPCFSDFR